MTGIDRPIADQHMLIYWPAVGTSTAAKRQYPADTNAVHCSLKVRPVPDPLSQH